jgi:hypothetical protein
MLLIVLLGSACLLAGCPGMPGAPGAGQQNMPPGIQPPPGLESGGARTLMGSTVTPPDNSILLVSFTSAESEPADVGEWQTCRRIIPLENCVLIEGLNYDGRDQDAPKDVNQLISYAHLQRFRWKYEARPAPPSEEGSEAGSGEQDTSD